MSPRPRKKGNKDLPKNLSCKTIKGVTYYQYNDPRDRKCHGMGTDKAVAVADANALNAAIYAEIATRRVKELVTRREAPKAGILFSTWIALYKEGLPGRKLSAETLRNRKCLADLWAKALDGKCLHEVTTLDISGVLSAYRKDGKARMAQAMRSAAIDIFKDAMADGHAKENPAKITRNPKVDVKRARLTLETFNAIHAKAVEQGDAYAINSQLLALVTAQRPEDLCAMQFRRGADWEKLFEAFMRREKGSHPYPHVHDGRLWVVQHKTGNLVRIPLTLRLNAIGLTVGDVVNKCRDGVASRFLLHHARRRTFSKPGDAVHKATISKAFARARDAAGLTWPMDPPTLYEIRSLAARLYDAQGVNSQLLLGHKNASMTAVYHDPRGVEWMEVEA